MVELVRQGHDGIRVCMRVVDGEYSDLFVVDQDPRQACAVTRLVPNKFFAAALSVAQQRFSEKSADIPG